MSLSNYRWQHSCRGLHFEESPHLSLTPSDVTLRLDSARLGEARVLLWVLWQYWPVAKNPCVYSSKVPPIGG